MLNTINVKAARFGDRMFAASRQMWLAGLGAAVVTRDWTEKEAGNVFRNLVREGTLVESRAVRVIGDRLDNSVALANMLWRGARSTVTSTVRAYADGAVALARHLPRALPGTEAKPQPAARKTRRTRTGAVPKAAKTAKRARKASRARA